MMVDVVVIGAGLAGLASALRLSHSGASVVVLARGVGSLHLGGATIDVLGYSPERVAAPGAVLRDLVASTPDHPYSRVGVHTVGAAIDWFLSQKELGRFEGGLERNFLLPTAVGGVKPSAVVPQSIAGGDVEREGTVVIVGFSRLKDFYPALVADNLDAAGVHARAVTLDVPLPAPLTREADVGGLGYARSLEDRDFLKSVIGALESQVEPGDRVGFPAVLGTTAATTVPVELADGLGCGVFEIPTLPPSVPGIRLYEALCAAIKGVGGRIVVGPLVVGGHGSGARLESIDVDAGARVTAYRADAFILASGGVSAGGVVMDSRWRITEPVLGLPVSYVPEPGGARFDADYFGRHPVARAGIAIDGNCRPISGAEPVYENVFVAGATVGGAEPWREGSGNGISLATGWRAAESIMQGM
ncbi:MAG: glycerol-3-phosphate dehydrogenase subunit GlpB [Actinomycetota bacterium]